MVNIFIKIMHVIKILNKSFEVIKMFQSYAFFFLIKNWYLSSHGYFAYKYILAISGWLFIKFNNAFVFLDPEPPIINIFYGWSGIYGQLGLCFLLFSLVYISKFIIYNIHYPAIFAVLIPYKVLWHNYLICVVTLIFLLYLFPPKSYDTIILLV